MNRTWGKMAIYNEKEYEFLNKSDGHLRFFHMILMT